MIKSIYEIFEEVRNCNLPEEKVQVLRKNDRQTLRIILSSGFDPNVKFTIRKVPFYKINDAPPGMADSNLDVEIKKFYLFLEGNAVHLSKEKKETKFREILEVLEKREAEVVINSVLKNLKVYGLNKRIVRQAFPNLISNEDNENV